MSAKRTERLLTLVMLLLSSRRGWTKEELFREIELYAEAPTPAAREKLFDRDKATLREQGIPVESFSEDPLFEQDNTSIRYRINAEDYRLPGMSFTAAESAALTVAAGMWAEAALGSSAARALRKLEGLGVGAGRGPTSPIDVRIHTNEPFWDVLWEATAKRRTVRFGYRAASTGDERQRTVQPWGLGTRFGHWYLVGYDVDRRAERWFRLSRMTSAPLTVEGTYSVPADFSMSASLASLPAVHGSSRATVEVRKGTCQLLRTRPGAVVGVRSDEWDVVDYGFTDEATAAAEIASLGANAVVISPPSLAFEVVRRLEGAVAGLEAAPPSFTLPEKPEPQTAGATGRRESSSAENRLLRLLDLVPYLLNHPGVEVAAAARDFGISPAQLIKDVELLFVSGPRFYPDGLIDIQLEEGRIQLSDPQALGEPIRFGLDEVCALLVGLDTLANLPGLPDDSAVRSAREKLRAAAGSTSRLNDSLAAVLTEDELTPVLSTLRTAIEQRRQVHLRYVVPARDEMTERFVEPLRAFLHEDAWYLDAWCHRAGGRRNFRLDRIRAIELTDAPAVMDESSLNPAPDVFDRSVASESVILVLASSARWIAQSYTAERSAVTDDGRLAAEIKVTTTSWIPGLIAGQGGECTVAAPSLLREQALTFARAALENYAPVRGT